MMLGVFEASAFNHKDTVDGVSVLFACGLGCSNYIWHNDIVKVVFFFRMNGLPMSL